MAFLDDPAMIIAHIRHSCVTGDETGLCEMVIVDEEKNEEQTFYQGRKRSVTGDLIDRFDERPYSQSLEISVTPSRRLHQRSERRDGRRQGPQVKTIKLQTDGNKKPELTESEVTGLFQPAEIPPRSNVPVVSMLALQLEEDGMSTDNIFSEYARYDGEFHEGQEVKEFTVFLTMLEDARQSVHVSVLAEATVSDFIGLILYKCYIDVQDPLLQDDVSNYNLRIAEEDGDIDDDFPPLDANETVGKFGFPVLGLVRKSLRSVKQTVVVTVKAPGGSSKIPFDNVQIGMQEVFEKVLKKRRLMRTGGDYVLEKLSEAGKPVDLTTSLADQQTTDFILVRKDSPQVQTKSDAATSVQATLTSHQYKSYRVTISHKLRQTSEVQLGVSGERIEVDPMQQPSFLFWTKSKPVSYDFDLIVWCEIMDEKHTGRTVFSFVHDTGLEFKSHFFEAQTAVAKEIVTQINNILETKVANERRTQFVAMMNDKEKRKDKRIIKSRSATILS